MAQEKTKLNKIKRVSLQQASVLFFVMLGLLIYVALFTFDPADPGFFNHDTNVEIVHNKAGRKGAWIADLFLGVFGGVAYLIPIILIALGFTAFRLGPHKKNPNNPRGGINSVISIIGAFIALFCATALAHSLFNSDTLPNGAGGALGQYVAALGANSFLGYIGSVLVLFIGFLIGITLVGDIHWGELTDKIGLAVISLFKFIQEKTISGIKEDEGLLEAVARVSKNLANTPKAWLKTLTSKLSFNKPFVIKDEAEERKEPKLDAKAHTTNKPIEPLIEKNNLDVPPRLAPNPNKANTKPVDKKQTIPYQNDNISIHLPNKTTSLPPIHLLDPAPEQQAPDSSRGLEQVEYINALAEKIPVILDNYTVKNAEVVEQHPGPIVTRFEIKLAPGTKVSKVTNLAKDLARNLGVPSVRVVEVIPGKTTIGLEVPNEHRELVAISEVISSKQYQRSRSPLTLVLGKDISGSPVVADLAKMPHLLVAGTTGSGKSVAVNAMLISLLYKSTPEEVRLLLVDPKMLELSIYEDIPHLLTPVVTDMKDAANGLRWCVAEMERRYMLMSKLKVRNMSGYNEKVNAAIAKGEPIVDPLYDPTKSFETQPEILEPLPHIVVVIDEFADMMMVVGKKVEELIARIAQKARAAGIHLILATQRPSVDVITGLIKANIPTRISFQVSTKIDSRTVLDQGGAENLLGHGDMLYLPPGTAIPQRVHGAFVSDEEVQKVVEYIRSQGEPNYIEGIVQDTGSDAIPGLEPLEDKNAESDPLYDEAVAIVTESRRASISYLQRRLKVGYNRAARMIEDMEAAGVVTPVQSNGTREVLAPEPPASS